MMKLLKINSILSWDDSYDKDNLLGMSDNEIDSIHKSFFELKLMTKEEKIDFLESRLTRDQRVLILKMRSSYKSVIIKYTLTGVDLQFINPLKILSKCL